MMNFFSINVFSCEDHNTTTESLLVSDYVNLDILYMLELKT